MHCSCSIGMAHSKEERSTALKHVDLFRREIYNSSPATGAAKTIKISPYSNGEGQLHYCERSCGALPCTRTLLINQSRSSKKRLSVRSMQWRRQEMAKAQAAPSSLPSFTLAHGPGCLGPISAVVCMYGCWLHNAVTPEAARL